MVAMMHKQLRFNKYLLLVFSSLLAWGCVEQSNTARVGTQVANTSEATTQTQVIKLDPAQGDYRLGGLIAADVNNDNRKDFIITKPDYIAAYSNSGQKLWSKKVNIHLSGKSEDHGLPGNQAPGVQAADVDGDNQSEVVFLTQDGKLQIVDGVSGEIEHQINLESPSGVEQWEHLVIADFRGRGDRDLLLQATNTEGYRMGRYLAAYSFSELLESDNPQPLWRRDDYLANAHNGARVADLDGDGKDEVLGGTIISPQGEVLFRLPLELKKRPHIDSLFVADVRPDLPGLEIIALEEGGKNRVFLYNIEGLIWETDYKNQEPQNAAIGDFDPERPGLEIWCRSRYNNDQKPFVFDAQGNLISEYVMNRVKPGDWTEKGVEVIFTIFWTGEAQPLAAAKERHKTGDVAVFNPISGEFIERFDDSADRLYVADVSGDWREELLVLNGNRLRIYSNLAPNPQPEQPRLWSLNHYRRNKMTWNYYSP